MEDLVLQHLLAKRSVPHEADSLTLTRRIKAEHIFCSVDHCFEYLRHVVKDHNFNPDDFAEKRIPSWTLIKNTVDEALCSLVYEIFKLKCRGDNDTLKYIFWQVKEFKEELATIILHDEADPSIPPEEIRFYRPLLTVFEDLYWMLQGDAVRREALSSESLEKDYYTLMWVICSSVKPYDGYYVRMKHFYEYLLKRGE